MGTTLMQSQTSLQMVDGYYTLTNDFSIDSSLNASLNELAKIKGLNPVVTFKKGQKVYGTFIPNIGVSTSSFPNIAGSAGVSIPLNNFSTIMEEYNKNLLLSNNATNKRLKDYQQGLIDFQKNAPIEDKFYQLFGLKYNPNSGNMFGFVGSSTFKGRFYLVIALVAGYFAYKKFKK
jgi:hypothetical protein